MKGFFGKLFGVSAVMISLSGIAHAQTGFSINSTGTPAFQNAGAIINGINQNKLGYTEDHAHEVCTSGIRSNNPDPTCQAIIQNCERNYNIIANEDPFDCSMQPDSNGFFSCTGADPTKAFNGVDSVDDQTQSHFINGLKASCGLGFSSIVAGGVRFPHDPNQIIGQFPAASGNTGTQTQDPAATPVTPPSTTDNSSNSDTANTPAVATGNGNNAMGTAMGTSSGCSMSPLQGGAPMMDFTFLSSLGLIPFVLRLRKKKQG
jgi:hypothetical protein